MEDGKWERPRVCGGFLPFTIYHLPFAIQAARFSAAW
jgi:hypothetical protein